jgi:hypothetical protein
VIVCRNCHRKLSDDQLDHAPRGHAEPDEGKLSSIGFFLLGLCDFLMLVIQRLREFSHWLITQSPLAEAVS